MDTKFQVGAQVAWTNQNRSYGCCYSGTIVRLNKRTARIKLDDKHSGAYAPYDSRNGHISIPYNWLKVA